MEEDCSGPVGQGMRGVLGSSVFSNITGQALELNNKCEHWNLSLNHFPNDRNVPNELVPPVSSSGPTVCEVCVTMDRLECLNS